MGLISHVKFTLGEATLHQLHTPLGKLFAMGEVALELFQETPTAFLQELRAGKYLKSVTSDRDVLMAVAELGLPVESSISAGGITLLPPATVETLLIDKRQLNLVQPFRLALLKLASQDAAKLMAAGNYEAALPVALESVKTGMALFQPSPAMQLFPLYLLAAQANLGLNLTKQCEDFLALASMLVLKDPDSTTNIMRSQLSRLYGQLYAMQNRHADALKAFAEDLYYFSLEYGPSDVRTTLGYYNMGKVFQTQGELPRCLACYDMVVAIWSGALKASVLGLGEDGAPVMGSPPELPVARVQLLEVVDMLQDINRLRASAPFNATNPQSDDFAIADTHLVTALALVYLQQRDAALDQLDAAAAKYEADDDEAQKLLDLARGRANLIAPPSVRSLY